MQTNRRLYRFIINELEDLYENETNAKRKIRLEEVANSVDEMFDSMSYKIEMLSEDIDILEDKILELTRR